MGRANIQPITQICQGDEIEFAINYFNMQGVLDLQSVEWFAPHMTRQPSHTALNYDAAKQSQDKTDKIVKIHCDLSRICEVEDTVVEWYDVKYYGKKKRLDSEFCKELEALKSNFTIANFDCAGIDGLIYKMHLQAKKPGSVLQNKILGLDVTIKAQAQRSMLRTLFVGNANETEENCLCNEVKRLGFLIDRQVDLQLRVGDSLIVYLNKSHA